MPYCKDCINDGSGAHHKTMSATANHASYNYFWFEFQISAINTKNYLLDIYKHEPELTINDDAWAMVGSCKSLKLNFRGISDFRFFSSI